LVIEDDDGLKRGVIISHNIKDNGGLPLVSAIAVKSANHSNYPFSVIGVTIKEFEGQGGFVQVDD
jgi:hypothetical protein